MRKGLLFVVSAPSGAGKTTLCHQLVATVEGLRHSISYTTRKPREGEVHGRDYFFVDEPAFRGMVGRSEFVEWASVYGNLYGTPRRYLLEMIEQGVDVLLEIDVQGAKHVRTMFADGVFIYILPPSLDVLQTRLHLRGGDSPEEIKRRLVQARDEIQHCRDYDYVVKNEDVQQALHELEAIVLAERIQVKHMDPRWIEEFADQSTDPKTTVKDPVGQRRSGG